MERRHKRGIMSATSSPGKNANETDGFRRTVKTHITIYPIGLPEGSEGNDKLQFIEHFIRKESEPLDEVYRRIPRCHRALGPKPPKEAKPRPMVVYFQEFKTKELVLHSAWKKKEIHHSGRQIYIDRDYPAETLAEKEGLSSPVTLTVRGLSPPASLIISPNRTQHFTSDSLSLSCEVQSDSTGWTVRRYTDNGEVSDCLSDWGSVTGSTCSISSLQSSDSGVYWCQSDSGGNSNPLSIAVTNGGVILESPVHPVTEGDTLTLSCRYRYDSSDLRADFYKDGLVLQNQTTGEMTIPTVSKSDEGLYWCKHPERGESPKSWITVRDGQASLSLSRLLCSLLVLSPYLLVTIVIGVKCW
ncbi:low affinity immunoglobulin gamma Fc region receptor II-like, partial [Chanos chanos]|uniref:low affinity immunoglobulin gamma Fc region receptor II-like n=1 Tax=Chanos chanos TaxID=29144 RepID=UPI0011F0BCCA